MRDRTDHEIKVLAHVVADPDNWCLNAERAEARHLEGDGNPEIWEGWATRSMEAKVKRWEQEHAWESAKPGYEYRPVREARDMRALALKKRTMKFKAQPAVVAKRMEMSEEDAVKPVNAAKFKAAEKAHLAEVKIAHDANAQLHEDEADRLEAIAAALPK